MDRKFLEEMGIEKENIDKILDNHHKTFEDIKAKLKTSEDTNATLQESIKTKDEDIKKLSESNQTAEELKKSLEEMKAKSEQQENEYKTKIADIEFNTLIEKAITGSKAKNVTAVKALLDLEKLKNSTNRETDALADLKALAEADDTKFLFGEIAVDKTNVGGDIDKTPPGTKKTLPKTF